MLDQYSGRHFDSCRYIRMENVPLPKSKQMVSTIKKVIKNMLIFFMSVLYQSFGNSKLLAQNSSK